MDHIPKTAAARAARAMSQTHRGSGAAGPSGIRGMSADSKEPSPGGRLYPQTGQPAANLAAEPEYPHRGHMTAEKKRPHSGHDGSFLETSAPQLSQKNRGALPGFRLTPWRISSRTCSETPWQELQPRASSVQKKPKPRRRKQIRKRNCLMPRHWRTRCRMPKRRSRNLRRWISRR